MKQITPITSLDQLKDLIRDNELLFVLFYESHPGYEITYKGHFEALNMLAVAWRDQPEVWKILTLDTKQVPEALKEFQNIIPGTTVCFRDGEREGQVDGKYYGLLNSLVSGQTMKSQEC
ncbi:hypothetical protein N7532_009733 [Penicillium argentinense]|uniref:Uncharacterized protein n=1 Tax=Penicillium argentinense TaxID=1131581 RepID=A0A9W9JXS6_9EURO|nr:uncharacterized protein N7532_009733 [Penicillium argentinense]KAJ5084962.1 hypothetical protein N7532_009733 [Penicillium argentinense]